MVFFHAASAVAASFGKLTSSRSTNRIGPKFVWKIEAVRNVVVILINININVITIIMIMLIKKKSVKE